jgi:UDP-sulfoquinovose synthase
MQVLVLGADGYIGFPLCMHLANIGFNVVGIDNFSRRKYVAEVGSHSATPIIPMSERLRVFEQTFGRKISFEFGDLRNYDFVLYALEEYKPEVIVHLGELASAPFSMMDAGHAVLTQTNNLVGTLNVLYAIKEQVPHCHLVKIGSMGEYGMPNIDIPEGFLEVEYRGRKDILPFPRQAFTDWYHWSKVHDSDNIMLACRMWNLRSSDIMQGVVYGTRTDEMVSDDLLTRFDFDSVFGTVINRFCAQAVSEHNLTAYGSGGQKRPVIALRDAIQCLLLAIQNPPDRGEYRVLNQFDEVYSVTEIAEKVKKVANGLGLSAEIEFFENPRIEEEQVNYYNPIHEKLYQLGFCAMHDFEEELETMLTDLRKYKYRLVAKSSRILPSVRWTGDNISYEPGKTGNIVQSNQTDSDKWRTSE